MKRIIVVNAKGGCGKTTVATNLAACYARRGLHTTLVDCDPQASSLAWLKLRESELPPIHGVALHDTGGAPLSGAWQMRVPRETQRVIVDTPAGTRAADLVGRVQSSDTLLVPIQPSAIDIRATADFVRDLMLVAKLRVQNRRLGIIVNRTRKNPATLETLTRFLDTLNIPVLERLRDSVLYADAADRGCGVVEMGLEAKHDIVSQWNAMVDWLEEGVVEEPAAARPRAGSSVRPVVESTVRTRPVLAATTQQPPREETLRLAEPRIPAFVSKNFKDYTRH